MNTVTASPAKLRDGSWGARVPGNAAKGDGVTIKTRAGKTWPARVVVVLWSGEDHKTGNPVSLCRTESLDRRSAPKSSLPTDEDGYRRGVVVGYRKPRKEEPQPEPEAPAPEPSDDEEMPF